MKENERNLTEKEKKEHAQYRMRVKQAMPKSKALKQCVCAFLVGGFICCIRQLVGDAVELLLNISKDDRGSFTSIIMIFLGALLTGLGVYDKIGAFAGAGSVVPVTGFANSIVAPAMEHKREGLVMGIGAQLFSLAGPVLVYGITSSIIVGIITWLTTLPGK